MAKLTEAGLIIESMSTLLEKKQDKAVELLTPFIPEGETLPTDSSSVLGRILQISAETDYLQEEAFQETAASLSPNSATGKNLDKIAQLKDMKRKPFAMGTAGLILYGDINVTVGFNSVVSSRSTGDQFSIDTSVTFKNTDCSGVEIELTGDFNLDGQITINYILSNDLSSPMPIVIKYFAGTTREALASFVKANIEQFSSNLSVTITNESNVQIAPTEKDLTGDFYVTGNAQIIRSFMPVNATSLYEVSVQEPDSITTIQSATFGWRGVTNPFSSLQSRPIESDDDLRMRFYKSTGSLATGHLAAMYSEINSLSGVSYVDIKENTFDQDSLDGRTAHGFSVIVHGGNDNEIASAIERTRPLGVPMNGNVTLSVNNYYNHTSTIKFSRPVRVGIRIKAGLQILEGFPPSGMIDIKNAIIDYFNTLTFGEDVLISRLYIPIQQVNGVGINSIQISKVGEPLGNQNIEIKYDEIATISFNDIEL